ncbi:MAG: glycoside hydrolase family 11 protein [Spirochaetales bacterium]|nr:glycoside hydrolase family 11 protein [Spirochaetales bacterium]
MNNLFYGKTEKILVGVLLISFISLFTVSAQTICQNQLGMHDGYHYELWKDVDSESACMTLHSGGAFSCEWINVKDMMARKGLIFDHTRRHQQIGTISVSYGCDFQPEENSYLGVYGRTIDPLIEYYILDNWGSVRPPDAESRGTINVDGDTYDIYETMWISSSIGDQNHPQYWSVRRSKRTSGTISVSQHFLMWESMGMDMGNIHDVTFVVEGFQSGNADVYSMSLDILDPDPTPNATDIPGETPGDVNSDETVDIVDALLIAQYFVGLNPADFNPDVADTNCDGTIDIVDALLTAQYYVGIINGFC